MQCVLLVVVLMGVICNSATPTLSEPVRKCPQCKQNDLVIKTKKDGG